MYHCPDSVSFVNKTNDETNSSLPLRLSVVCLLEARYHEQAANRHCFQERGIGDAEAIVATDYKPLKSTSGLAAMNKLATTYAPVVFTGRLPYLHERGGGSTD